jgi:small-conductance mechanosensitive channel
MLHRPGAFRSRLNFAVYDKLKERGIEMPPPHDPLVRSPQGSAAAPHPES